MLRCEDCEFYHRNPDGSVRLTCDPFSTIKEPECLMKHQFVKMEQLSQSYESMLEMYRRLAPLQERMFQQMERELDEIDDADRWKLGSEEEDEEDEESGPI